MGVRPADVVDRGKSMEAPRQENAAVSWKNSEETPVAVAEGGPKQAGARTRSLQLVYEELESDIE